jgi:hypothetical protein
LGIRAIASAHIDHKEFVVTWSLPGRLCADDFADE